MKMLEEMGYVVPDENPMDGKLEQKQSIPPPLG